MRDPRQGESMEDPGQVESMDEHLAMRLQIEEGLSESSSQRSTVPSNASL
jgi:hypothetical protein